jgi:hypothetical protein
MKYHTLAKAAYEDYANYTDWKNYQGMAMPQWDDLPDYIQKAWCCAASAVTFEVLRDVKAAKEMSNTEIVPARTIL